ncbi:MAG: phosphoesterase [Legionellales bacterium]|nr:phosphoesterase [Legionellales bacterium]|tara:strand:- start:9246 stop:10361 length:1116 start_codon:yes stop_codon:yes gene_type:complete
MAAAQQQNPSDNSMGLLWIMIAIVVFGLLAWYFFHEYIIAGFMAVKLAEVSFISIFSDSIEQTRQALLNTPLRKISLQGAVTVSREVGDYLKYPVAIILGVLAAIIYGSSTGSKFKTIHNMKTLAEQEKQNWPQISMVTKLDLVSEHIEKGDWAVALTPMQFAKKYKLLKKDKQNIGSKGLSKDIQIVVTVIKPKATKVFAGQIGQPWQGPNKLKPYAKALFAAFAAKACDDDAGCRRLLNQLAESMGKGKLDTSGTDELLKKHINNKIIKKVLNAHAYELGMMATMLQLARMDGVLSSAEFVWLKPMDRPLWFMLNTVGRQTPCTEIAGPYAHWLAEIEIGRRLSVPMVEEASNALEEAISKIRYTEDED